MEIVSFILKLCSFSATRSLVRDNVPFDTRIQVTVNFPMLMAEVEVRPLHRPEKAFSHPLADTLYGLFFVA